LPPKAKITAEVCSGRRRPKLPGDHIADDESGDTPEHGCDGGDFDGPVHVFVARVGRYRGLE
jgi:hypothetical protein